MTQGSTRGLHDLAVTIGDRTTRLTCAQAASVGRGARCDVVADDPMVSKIHAHLVPGTSGWYLEDRGSTNGTYLDGSPVTRLAVDRAVEVTLSAPWDGLLVQIVPVAAPDPHGVPVARRLKADSPPVLREQGMVVGRAAGCEVVLHDLLVSHRHAALRPTPEGLHLIDLRSRNGTYVNGRLVTEALLHEGDLVTVGNTDLVVADGLPVPARLPRVPHPRLSQPHLSQAASALLPLTPPAAARPDRLLVEAVEYALPDGRLLLDGVSFCAEQGTLTAVIGPSGAGKSTLVSVISGAVVPSRGAVELSDLDLHASFAALSTRAGVVPQDDIVHLDLTVLQVLRYAARLRLTATVRQAEREAIIASVMSDLDLTEHAHTRVSLVSGGQRKRVSIAVELLTEPALLILDEPTSGLDPALDKQVMLLLRGLADRGHIVVVVTHSLAHLSLCDDVLLLAPGGRPAYLGPTEGVVDTFGTTDWADIFFSLDHAPPPQPPQATPERPPRRLPERAGRRRPGAVRHHLRTVVHRQVRLLLADTRYLLFLVALPILSGALALVVPGSAGFGTAGTDAPTEAGQLLTVLILVATFMGSALTVRDLVGERSIFLRERRAGLSPTAYLLAKTIVYGAFTAFQSAALVAVVCLVRDVPATSTWLPWPAVELFLGIGLTAFASAMLALCGSAWVRSTDQVMPLLVLLVMTQLVVAGGMIPVTGRQGLSQVSWLFPSRWGYSATSSTIDLRSVVPLAQPDALWRHEAGQWFFDAGMLLLIVVVALLVTAGMLRRGRTAPRLRHGRARPRLRSRQSDSSRPATPLTTSTRDGRPRVPDIRWLDSLGSDVATPGEHHAPRQPSARHPRAHRAPADLPAQPAARTGAGRAGR